MSKIDVESLAVDYDANFVINEITKPGLMESKEINQNYQMRKLVNISLYVINQ
jgi:hypothetical protein